MNVLAFLIATALASPFDSGAGYGMIESAAGWCPSGVCAGVLLGPNGTAGAPTFSFSGDPNNGLYLSTTDTLGFSAGGGLRMSIDGNGIYTIPIFTSAVGTKTAPRYSIQGDTDTGMFFTAGSVSFTTDDTLTLSLAATAATFAIPAVVPDGAVGAPGLAFASYTTTGLYAAAGPILSMSIAGAEVFNARAANVRSTVPFYTTTSYNFTGGAGFATSFTNSALTFDAEANATISHNDEGRDLSIFTKEASATINLGGLALYTGAQTNAGDYYTGGIDIYTGDTTTDGDPGAITFKTGATGGPSSDASPILFQTDGANTRLTIAGDGSSISMTPINLITGAEKAMTDGSAVDFVRIGVAQGSYNNGTIWFSLAVVENGGGSDLQSMSGELSFAAVNKAGTVTCDVVEAFGADAYAESNGPSSLTVTFACTEDAADTIDISANVNTSFAATTVLKLEFSVQTEEDFTVTAL